MVDENRDALQRCVHRHVLERVAFLTVPQQASTRRASKALWEAVRAASMENLLRFTVFEHEDPSTAQLVVVAMSRAVGPFPSSDALLAWSGGLALLYAELQLCFPHAAAMGISTRLAAIRPFPFSVGSTVATMCVVTANPPMHAIESIELGVRDAWGDLSHNNAACPILCLEGAIPRQLLRMMDGTPLSSLPSIRGIQPSAFQQCASLQSVCLANVPLLECIGDRAFSECTRLTTVELSELPLLRTIGNSAFQKCTTLQSMSLKNLPLFESIGDQAFSECGQLSVLAVDLSELRSLHTIGKGAFEKCKSLCSMSFANAPLLRIGDRAFFECVGLTSVEISCVPPLRTSRNALLFSLSGSICYQSSRASATKLSLNVDSSLS